MVFGVPNKQFMVKSIIKKSFPYTTLKKKFKKYKKYIYTCIKEMQYAATCS